MKKQLFNLKNVILILATGLIGMNVYGQMQIDNPGFENWDDEGTSSEEPANWNSFMTADCTLGAGLCGFAQSQHVEQSTDAHSGTYSARIWSTAPIPGVVANGNMTLGRVHMGSTTASDPANYNYTDITNPDFNQILTDRPDSLVAWVKFNPQTATDIARISASIHDSYNYRDPEDANATPHVVAHAVLNYSTTNGAWKRISIPFDYVGPSIDIQFILITFTTNMAPGGGSVNDEVFIDDVELIYNMNKVKITPVADQNLEENEVGIELTANETPLTGISVTSRQWRYSMTTGGPYNNDILGQTAPTYTPLFANAGTYYVACGTNFEGDVVTSNEVKITVTPTVGLTENEMMSFAVYATDQTLNVDFSNIDMDNASIKVLSVDGRVVAKHTLEGNKLNSIQLSVPTGIYFYSIGNGEHFYQGKVFINK